MTKQEFMTWRGSRKRIGAPKRLKRKRKAARLRPRPRRRRRSSDFEQALALVGLFQLGKWLMRKL